MQLKVVAVLFYLLLPAAVLSAPIDASEANELYARAAVVNVHADPTGDFKTLLHKPADPEALEEGCSAKEKKEHKKQDRICRKWKDVHATFVNTVTPRVVAAIHAAEAALDLPSPIDVLVKSDYHENKAHDDLFHWTFSFAAPVCGGRCVGHAYKAGEVRQARIFSADHRTLFGA
ncbi:unnamed protein product [Cyclocybe aegerita]|uniref:Uncharacterized protein n=1 Tax=Cyclocybe aegerita TaxID=1973307 RepID=A0A8S0WNV2_CYCAE|nr:unnamed protein product [Cyclocybe aegerita]